MIFQEICSRLNTSAISEALPTIASSMRKKTQLHIAEILWLTQPPNNWSPRCALSRTPAWRVGAGQIKQHTGSTRSPHTAHACLKRHCRLAHLPSFFCASTQSQHSPLRTRFSRPKPALPSWRLPSIFRGKGGRPDGVGGGSTWVFTLSAFKIFGRSMSTKTWRSMSLSTTMFVKALSSVCPAKHTAPRLAPWWYATGLQCSQA